MLQQVLRVHDAEGRSLDVANLTIVLSVDFILASMFGVDCRALQVCLLSLNTFVLFEHDSFYFSIKWCSIISHYFSSM